MSTEPSGKPAIREILRAVFRLRIDQLQLVAFAQNKLRACFRADANPVEAGRGGYMPMQSLLPTNSRPSYNTISTGIPYR